MVDADTQRHRKRGAPQEPAQHRVGARWIASSGPRQRSPPPGGRARGRPSRGAGPSASGVGAQPGAPARARAPRRSGMSSGRCSSSYGEGHHDVGDRRQRLGEAPQVDRMVAAGRPVEAAGPSLEVPGHRGLLCAAAQPEPGQVVAVEAARRRTPATTGTRRRRARAARTAAAHSRPWSTPAISAVAIASPAGQPRDRPRHVQAHARLAGDRARRARRARSPRSRSPLPCTRTGRSGSG